MVEPRELPVKEAISVPVFANGNIILLKETVCDAAMNAESQCCNPILFEHPEEFADNAPEGLLRQHVPHVDLAIECLQICKGLNIRPARAISSGECCLALHRRQTYGEGAD